MAEPIEEVYVEIGADTAPLDAGVKKSSEKNTRKLKTEFEKAADAIERQLARTAKSVEKNLAKIAEDGTVSAAEVEAALTHAARAIEDEYQQMAKSVEKSFAKVDAAAAGTAAFTEAVTGASKGAEGLEEQMNGLGKALQASASGASALGPGILVLAGAIIFLTPVVVALAAALAQLVGLVAILPAGIGLLVTAVLPLVVAFKGFGDALSAISSGDVKKIDEALKKLSPSARAVALEFQKLQPTLEAFKKTVQEAFFKPLVGDLTRLAKVLLPSLKGGFAAVAGQFGKLFDNLARYLGQKNVIKQINDLFKNTADILASFTNVGPAVFQGFLDAATALAPVLNSLVKRFTSLAATFGEWLSKVSKSGQLKKWFDDAMRVAGELWDLFKAIGGLIGTIFGHVASDGEDVIKTFTDVINKFNEFYKSADGQKALDDAKKVIQGFISVLEDTVDTLLWIAHATNTVIDVYKAFYNGIKDLASFLAGVVVTALTKTGDFFVWLGGKIMDGLGAALDFVVEWFGKIVDWFVALPGKIWAAIQSIPGLIVKVLKSSFDQALFLIGAAIGLIIVTIKKFPDFVVSTFTNMKAWLTTFFTNLWNWLVTSIVNGFTSAVQNVKAFGQMIVNGFVSFWNSAVAFTRRSVANIIDFIVALPGRVVAFTKSAAAAIGNFFANVFNTGKARAKSAIDGIVDFIRQLPSRLTGFVKNVGGDIANVIKDMLNYAIRKINSGIASVDKAIPGVDLPRIPELAKGAVVMPTGGGTVVKVAEAGEPEAVMPLSVLKKYVDGPGSGAMTVTFGPGSITVEYNGAQAPTESEATTMGAAIGHGIASTLEKRDVRTSVRRI